MYSSKRPIIHIESTQHEHDYISLWHTVLLWFMRRFWKDVSYIFLCKTLKPSCYPNFRNLGEIKLVNGLEYTLYKDACLSIWQNVLMRLMKGRFLNKFPSIFLCKVNILYLCSSWKENLLTGTFLNFSYVNFRPPNSWPMQTWRDFECTLHEEAFESIWHMHHMNLLYQRMLFDKFGWDS